MGTRIKPIKCPNCGSEKHTHKEDKCYLCLSCGTEFYIDDDDINIKRQTITLTISPHLMTL